MHSDLKLRLNLLYLTNSYRSPTTYPKLKILHRRYEHGRISATNESIDVSYADQTVIPERQRLMIRRYLVCRVSTQPVRDGANAV